MRVMFFWVMAALLLAGCAEQSARAPREPVIGTADGRWPSDEATQPMDGTPMTPQFPADNTPYAQAQNAIPAANNAVNGVVPADALREAIRVAILVPQTGPNAAVGEAILQAAQLAVFDLNEPSFQLIPKNTMGTPDGARNAVNEAAREGTKLVLGPLFSAEVDAAKDAARGYGLTMLAFSTDWRVAGDNVYSMGVLPFGQAQRMAEFAARQGLKRVAILAPRDMYGDATLSVFQTTAARYGVNIVTTVRMAADGSDAPQAAQQLSGGQMIAADRLPYDAIFMPVPSNTARTLAGALRGYGLGSDRVKYLGTGLWDDPQLLGDTAMAGAYYAAPSPQVRASFERNYQRVYGTMPPRIASIGYDAAALAIVLARNATQAGQRVVYDRAGLTNPNGFSGVDGIFRFGQNGLAERGVAVLQIAGRQARVIEPAPTSFMAP